LLIYEKTSISRRILFINFYSFCCYLFCGVEYLKNKIMKQLTQYNSKVSNLFFDYLQNGDKEKLETELKTLEKYHKDLTQSKNNKQIWFKFYKNDTGATTISELISDLKIGSKNRNYRLEQMEESISLDGELLIFYS
jgi:hypothetical protein